MAKRTSKKVRKVKSNDKTSKLVADRGVATAPEAPAVQPASAAHPVTPSTRTAISRPADVGLTAVEPLWAAVDEQAPAVSEPDMGLSDAQLRQIEEEQLTERFGRVPKDARDAINLQLDNKLRSI